MICPLGGIGPTHFGAKPEHYAQLTEFRVWVAATRRSSARATYSAPRTQMTERVAATVVRALRWSRSRAAYLRRAYCRLADKHENAPAAAWFGSQFEKPGVGILKMINAITLY